MFFRDILFRNCRKEVYVALYQLYMNRLMLCFGVFSKDSTRTSQMLIWLYEGNFALRANTCRPSLSRTFRIADAFFQ